LQGSENKLKNVLCFFPDIIFNIEFLNILHKNTAAYCDSKGEWILLSS